MDLILWRHAEAEAGEPDLGRRLTTKGRKHAARIGGWLEHHLPTTCRILVSPAERAQQTALALKRKFRTVDALAPGATVDDLLVVARWPESRECVVIVGHQPTLGQAAAKLLGGVEGEWPIRKCGVWWLGCRRNDACTGVTLRVAIGPDFI